MEIRGDLGRNKVTDLLQTLAALGRSGRLTIDDARGLKAVISFANGKPHSAQCGHLRGVEAILACLFWYEGTFVFQADTKEPTNPPDEGLGDSFQLTRFLLDAMFLADELEKRRALVPEAFTPLRLKRLLDGENPFDCGVMVVQEAIQRLGSVATLQKLEGHLSLAPIKVRLSLAWLVEQGALPGPSETLVESSDKVSRWWAEAAPRFGCSLPIAIAVVPEHLTEAALLGLVDFLKKKLKAADAWYSFSRSGPSFVRLRPQGGGAVTVTVVPCEEGGHRECIAYLHASDFFIRVGEKSESAVACKEVLNRPVYFFPTFEIFVEHFTDLLRGTLGQKHERKER